MSKLGHPRKLTLELIFEDNASLEQMLMRLIQRGSQIGPIHLNSTHATCTGDMKFYIPMQEPREEAIDGEWNLIYKSNFK